MYSILRNVQKRKMVRANDKRNKKYGHLLKVKFYFHRNMSSGSVFGTYIQTTRVTEA